MAATKKTFARWIFIPGLGWRIVTNRKYFPGDIANVRTHKGGQAMVRLSKALGYSKEGYTYWQVDPRGCKAVIPHAEDKETL